MARAKSTAVGIVLMAALLPVAQAQPRVSPWQRINEPALGARQFVQQFADHKREPRDPEHETEALRTQLHQAAATWLERVVGPMLASTEDPDLLLLYGECLAFAGPAQLDRAEVVLTRALWLAPNHPAARGAWNTLGRVQAARGQADAAQNAFERALELEWDGATRAEVQIEQGLLAMRQEEFERAIERLTAARDATQQPAQWAFSQWALGVAIDRALLGPEGAALAWTASQGRFGANGEHDVLALPGVAPDPASEATYYRALALLGRAQATPEANRVSALLESKFLWLAYVREVGPLDPFVARARHHLAKIDELTTSRENDAELDRRARAPMDLAVDVDAGATDHMIWPEELTQEAFWGADAGSASTAAPTP